MTSACTETGMQGFEQMQGVIRDFLQRMIELMKSTEFATALRNAMDMCLKIAKDVYKRQPLYSNVPLKLKQL